MHVIIVDDHPLLIKGLEALLAELDRSVTTRGARSVQEALQAAADTPPNLVLLDLNLPGMRDLDALVHVRSALSSTPIVVVSANDSPEYIWKAVELGAAGYITKDTDQALMINALRVVLSSGVYLPPHALRSEGASPAAAPVLSDRQISVLRRLLQGKSNKVIARDLAIAEGTVKAHLWSIYQALGVSSRLQAMAKAHELRLVEKFGSVD
jgi:DNA-binding NarL/FixJ family response regulator